MSELQSPEDRAIEACRALLEETESSETVPRQALSDLLRQFEMLNKKIKRVVKLNDKQQEREKKLNDQLNQQNRVLGSLSQDLSKYLSPQLYESIFHGRTDVKLNARRKKLTIFFSDIANFTAITERMEPEELTYFLNSYLDEMCRIALKHGAMIDKFIGDALLLFFGDPESRGPREDALACVRMALEMRRRLEALGKVWVGMGVSEPFQARMGITTGYCTVGNFGSAARMDYTIIGGQVNLASRLESNAQTNDILISHETYALVKDEVFCERKETIFVKGIPYPIHTYKVIDLFSNIQKVDEITENTDGFSIYLNPDRIDAGRKDVLLEKLRLVTERIQSL